MQTTTSKDGTQIAFEVTGSGPLVVLVGGAFNTRTFGPNVGLAPLLAEHFTVVSYDRRGRGDSGNRLPWSIDRECEDLEAVIRANGPSACVYGISSGAALVLEAAKRGAPIRKLALFEAPFVVEKTSRPQIPRDWIAQLDALIAADRRGEAVSFFMTRGVNLPTAMVMFMKLLPAWKRLKSAVHTVPYDAALLGDHAFGEPLNPSEWAKVTMPKLVIDGGKSPAWIRNSMRSLAEALDCELVTLPGQMHIVRPAAIAPTLIQFFRS